jgi:hypothetical protein
MDKALGEDRVRSIGMAEVRRVIGEAALGVVAAAETGIESGFLMTDGDARVERGGEDLVHASGQYA